MGWETRGNNTYYYRKLRVGKKVRSAYAGSGLLTEFIAAQDEAFRLCEVWKQEGVQIFHADHERADEALVAYSEAVTEWAELYLYALGLYRRRGEWRRCQAARLPEPQQEPALRPPTAIDQSENQHVMPKASVYDTLSKNEGLVRSTLQEALNLKRQLELALEQGEHETYNYYLGQLRRVLQDHPTGWQWTSDLCARTAEALCYVVTKSEPEARALILRGLAQLRRDLGYEESPPLEQLLIDRVALAWLSCQITEQCYAALAFKGGEEPEHGAYWERRLAKAERRLQRSVEALARTRKLVRSTKAVRSDYTRQQAAVTESLRPHLALVSLPSGPLPAEPEEDEELLDLAGMTYEERREALIQKNMKGGMDRDTAEGWVDFTCEAEEPEL